MNETLRQFSDGVASVVAAAAPAVMRVEGRRRLPATGIAWSADGLVVTAHHVIERDEEIRVAIGEGDAAPAMLVGRDPSTDLAVLRLEGAALTPAEWSDLRSVAVGQLALALGRPGRTVQATLGLVSALGREWRTHAGGRIDRFLQTDVVMYPGFSGGPLMDVAGRVLGVNTSALARGVSVAVPPATVARVVAALIEHGRVRRGHLGVAVQPVRLPERLAEELGQDSGLMLVSVEPDSPAEAAGLVMGDTIVAIAGSAVRGLDDLLAALSGDRVGESVTVRFVRGGALHQLQVVPGERQ